jgi:hypothetical protein
VITGLSYYTFRWQLTGESPLLCASGFHPPAFSITAYSAKDDPFKAFAYWLDFIIKSRKKQVVFPAK